MTDTDETATAIDVIRCVYLARLAEQRGDDESARRWQAKADEWLAMQKGAKTNPGWSATGHETTSRGSA